MPLARTTRDAAQARHNVVAVAPALVAQQALPVFECLRALREALWGSYGPQVQQAWRDQLLPERDLPDFDLDQPF